MLTNNFRAQITENFRVAELAKKHKKRSGIDVIRTALWFDSVIADLNVGSAYEVGKKVQPDKFVDNGSDITENGVKWHEYQAGKHTPSQTLIDQIENVAPGSRVLINHPLWKVLQAGQLDKQKIAQYLAKIDTNTKKIIFADPESLTLQNRKRTSIQLFDALERQYNLDSLTALTLLLMEAIADNKTNDSTRLMTRIHRTILVLSLADPYANFASVLYYLFYSKIFNKLNMQVNSATFYDASFNSKVFLTQKVFWNFEDQCRLAMWEPKICNQAFFEFFRGMRGVNDAIRLLPPWIYNHQEKVASNEDDLYLLCKYA